MYAVIILTALVFTGIILAADPFIGIGTEQNEEPVGLRITQVVRNSSAAISGLETNDVIIAIDGTAIPDRDSLTAFLSNKNPGDFIKITIDRCGNKLRMPLILGNKDDFQGSMKLGEREDFPTDADAIYPGWRADSITILALETIDEAGLSEQYDKLANAFAVELEDYHGHFTLDAVALPLLQPAAVYVSGERVKRELSAAGGDPVNIWAGVPIVLDEDIREDLPKPAPGSIEGIIECIRQANAQIDSAFAGLSEEELFDLADIAPYMLDIFTQTILIDSDPNEDLVDSYLEMIASAKKIELGNLLRCGKLLSGLYEPAELRHLVEIQPGHGADSMRDILLDTLVIVNTDEDSVVLARLIVTGTGDGVYYEQAAIWIDLGGDDTYFGFCGGTPYTIVNGDEHNFASGHVGAHIDLGGDDTYIRNTPGSIGSGFCGGGCLIDLAGNDRYSGDRLSQGAAFCGTGMLVDFDGDDIYDAQECAQAFAIFGAALLYDALGDDIYTGARYVQGVGVTKGLGILVDHSGNDRYIAAFKNPNSYGNEDTWDGWSQGVGMGLRHLAAGGIGLLIDRSGDDNYLAGNFSQACGYFFGLGIFEDVAGNDTVIGNRYVQGAGAHQAAALFRDRSGNDAYFGGEATNQAGTWDITTAFFIDDLGDDYYSGAGLSQGGAAQNGFAAFIDFDGVDEYHISGGNSSGAGGGNDYHPDYDAKSIGVFIDLGDERDDYSGIKDKRKNNKLHRTGKDSENCGDGAFRDE